MCLAVSALAVITASATDFWISKDWKQWSRSDCENLLTESPWAHAWKGGGQSGAELAYSVQLRSALPVRQAIVRQLQLDQKYDKMTEAQRTAFDSQASQILNRSYDDVILVHVDYSKSGASNSLQGLLNSFHSDADTFTASFSTEDGTRVTPARVDIGKNQAFDLIFPRTKDGLPVIKDRQKRFSIQFQSPQFLNSSTGITIPNKRIDLQFDLSKMIVDGKLAY